MKRLIDFTNIYQRSKTLRFRLEPIGKTADYIKNYQYLETDERLAKESKKVKELADEYHKEFIGDVLSSLELPLSKINELWDIYMSNDTDREIKFKKLQENLRKVIAEAFSKDKRFGNLFKKEIITDILPKFLQDKDDDIKIVNRFKGFTTYFYAFHKNRENMYVSEEKSTAIPYRIVNQNLVKYFDNYKTFKEKVMPLLKDKNIVESIERDFKDILNEKSIEDVFGLANFTHTLCQADIEKYNTLIGGLVVKNEKKEIKGINQYINEHNQTSKKGNGIPKLKPLFNQILSDRKSLSFTLDDIKKTSEAIRTIKDEYENLRDKLATIERLIKSIKEHDLAGIYIKMGEDTSTISQHWFGAYYKIIEAIADAWERRNPKKNRESKAYSKYVSSLKSISLQEIDDLKIGEPIENYFATFGTTCSGRTSGVSSLNRIEAAYTEFVTKFPEGFEDGNDCNDAYFKANVEVVKNLLDSIKDFQRFVKPLLGNEDERDKDEAFYGEFVPTYTDMDNIITPLYNRVRNFATKKPYSTDKIKINFENVVLLKGWDKNKESDYASIILMKDGQYFLGVLRNGSKSTLKTILPNTGDCYQKMVYKYFKDIKSNLPRCTTQRKDVKAHFAESSDDYSLLDTKTFVSALTISREVFELYNAPDKEKKFKKEYLKNTNDSIGYANAVSVCKHFCLEFLKKYRSTAIYNLSDVETSVDSFDNLSSFYQEIDKRLYSISFENVSVDSVNELVDNGNMLLFRIANKDFSPNSKGRPNLHTIYWRMLFDPANLKDVVYQLNGNAEIFFRKASVTRTEPTHPANVAIKNKSEYNKQNKPYSTFKYGLIKDRRYTTDQFEFHVPITMNFKQPESSKLQDKLNKQVLDFLKQDGVRHIIGIDRGERNLLYLVMIDMEGKIKKQISLNEIAGNPKNPEFKQDFHALLHEREGDRLESRRSWNTIQSIKELKEGYMSLVVHEIANMMLENDAIVVLENLNRSFMQKRGGIEKSVYQKFEKMLIDKLGYIVDKTKDVSDNGGALHAVQLADTFENFNKAQKGAIRQCGFIFYIPAWRTSKIDPVTGFVPMLRCQYESIVESKKFFGKFDSIYYDATGKYFVFQTDFTKFNTESKGGIQKWDICTYGDRIYTPRTKDRNNNPVSERVNLTEKMKSLFVSHNINIQGDIKAGIMQQTDKVFFEQLHRLLRLTLQIRNSKKSTGKDYEDYIISPVMGKDGRFFDSRNADATQPKDADANGAYNIARKGLMLLRQIQAQEKQDLSNGKWLEFAQR